MTRQANQTIRVIQRNVGMLPKQKQVTELLAALRGLQEMVMAGIRRVGDDSPGPHWTEGRKPQILTQNDDGETLEGAIFTLVSTSETRAEVLTTTHYDNEYGYFFEMVRARARKAVKCGLGKVGPGGKPPMVKISGMHPCVGGLRQVHAERADGRGVMGSCCPAQVRARAEERLLMPQETGEVAALVRGAWSTRYDVLEMCEYSVRFTARNGRYAPCTVGGCGGRLALCRAWHEEMPEEAYALYLLHRRPAEAAQYVPETTGAIEVAGRGRGGGAGRGAGRGKGEGGGGGGKGGKGGGGTPPARMITCAGCGNRARDMRRDSAGGDYCGDCWAAADRMQEELEEEGTRFHVDAVEQQQEDAEMTTAEGAQQEGDASAKRAAEVGAAIEGGGEGGGEQRNKAAAAAEARRSAKATSPGAAGSGKEKRGASPNARGSPAGGIRKSGGGSAKKSARKQARLEAAAALAAGAQKGGAQ